MMSHRPVLRLLGLLWIGIATCLLVYLFIDFFSREGFRWALTLNAFVVLIIVFVILVLGLLLWTSTRKLQTHEISSRSAAVSVILVWMSIILSGMLPYIWAGIDFADAFFESASGFSTTGATIFNDIEAVSPALLFWRSLSQWIGGMGIIVLFVAIFPSLGVSGKRLFSNEMPGPIKESLTPHLKDTTRQLWLIYVSLTILLAIILMSLGLSVFDAINHAFTTLATGGFSTKNASLAAFSPTVQWVVTLFMLLGGLNFSLYILLLKRQYNPILRDIEVRWYLNFILGLSLIVSCLLLVTTDYSLEEAFRFAFFTVISLTTTTGYTNVDYEFFAIFLQALLFLTFFTGGSAGSTSGGVKFYRIVLFFKALSIEIKKSISPHAVTTLTIGGAPIRHELMSKILIFLCVYSLSVLTISLLLMGDGIDFMTAASAAASAVGNVGPAFGDVGPTESYAHLSRFAKIVLGGGMILGRLEFFAFLAALHPDFWKRRTT